MSIDEKKAKIDAFQTLNQDGLFEIFMGMSLLAIAIYLFFLTVDDLPLAIFIILPGLLMGPFLIRARKRYTFPRIGYVNIVPRKNNRILILFFMLTN